MAIISIDACEIAGLEVNRLVNAPIVSFTGLWLARKLQTAVIEFGAGKNTGQVFR